MSDKYGHETRFSDSSLYDEICIKCGATDARGSDKLDKPCPVPRPPTMPENKAPTEIWIASTEFSYEMMDAVKHPHGIEAGGIQAIKYINATHHNHVKAKLINLIDLYIISDDYDKVDQIKQRNKYLEREGLGFLVEL